MVVKYEHDTTNDGYYTYVIELQNHATGEWYLQHYAFVKYQHAMAFVAKEVSGSWTSLTNGWQNSLKHKSIFGKKHGSIRIRCLNLVKPEDCTSEALLG